MLIPNSCFISKRNLACLIQFDRMHQISPYYFNLQRLPRILYYLLINKLIRLLHNACLRRRVLEQFLVKCQFEHLVTQLVQMITPSKNCYLLVSQSVHIELHYSH